jgi:Uma2 family endonuclease
MTVAEMLDTYEVDDLADLDPIPKGYELIDGDLVEKPDMGAESSVTVGRLFRQLDTWCEQHKAGLAVTGEAGYRCFSHKPRQVRKPDVSVLLGDPVQIVVPPGDFLIVPSLVVEVVSPNETMNELTLKIEDFLATGTDLAWAVEPQLRMVFIPRADGTVTKLRDPATLSGESILPGFSIPLASFLPPVREPQPGDPQS